MNQTIYIPFLLLLLSLTCLSSLLAQNHVLLKAEGEIPREFITPSTDKYEKQVARLDAKKTKTKTRDQKNKKRFALESNFAIDDILKSGLVLFNDEASNYVNKVLGQLPIEDRRLQRKEPRAYVLNTSAVNAFATDQGIVFVTMGLLANLENEAQLAFILAHELIHISHQHGIDKFLNAKEVDRGGGREGNFDQVTIDRKMFEKSLYSRQLEEEADEEGLKLFTKSVYDPKAVLNTFHVLHYSYLPFEDYPFDRSFFEDTNYIFPEKIWIEKVNSISIMDAGSEEEEERSSHPSSMKRLNKLKSSVEGLTSEGKKTFVFDQSEFEAVRERARYQIPFLELYAENFAEAIYTSYLLLREQPDNLELKKVVGKSLYMLAKYRNAGDRRILPSKAKKKEGSIHQLYHLLAKMRKSEQIILATKYNWALYQAHQEDEELQAIIEDMFTEFAAQFESLDEFSRKDLPVAKAEEVIVEQTAEEEQSSTATEGGDQGSIATLNTPIKELSKMEKIKLLEEKGEDEEEEEVEAIEPEAYWKYAFVEELKQDSFIAYFEKGQAVIAERDEMDEYYETDEGRRAWRDRMKEEEKFGKRLGIDKIVVVNPFYLSLDERKEGVVQFVRSEEKQVYFRSQLDKLSKLSNVKATMLDVTNLSKNSIDKFNDIVEINQYFRQQMDQYDLTLTAGYNQTQVNDIADKYGTDYFLWTGVIALHEKNTKWKAAVWSILMPYLMPFAVLNAVTPEYDMLYYAILFDVKTGRRSVIKMDYFNQRDTKGFLNAHIYDVFQQIGSTEQ